MDKSESIKELAAALSEVKFPQIPRNKTVKVTSRTGSSYTFNYAPLETIMGAIRKPLSDAGITITQSISESVIETTLLHKSGEWISSYVPVSSKDGASAQEAGSSITYARRYGITLACGIVADEDDDANLADGNEVSFKKKPEPSKKVTQQAFDSLSPDMQTIARDLGKEVNMLMKQGATATAYQRIMDEDLKQYDPSVETGFWSFIESYDRAALKRYKDEVNGV